MCGIAGQISYNHLVYFDDIRSMIDVIFHRGPDDEGIYINEKSPGEAVSGSLPSVGLGHRRLSIIDLSTGHQPIHNEDKKTWVVYNGETYNFQALKKELIAKGHRFYTTTDTEVLVHLYEEYGEDCVQHLRGMFSFALWDENEKKLLIARDRMGKKPLYYNWDGSMLLFASELKSILACPSFERKLNHGAFLSFLLYGYVPDPQSIFEGVKKLPPAHVLTLSNKDLKIREYWRADFTPQALVGEEEVSELLLQKLRESVKMRLISDVPLGAFLSGGIDSSTIVALMAQEMTEPVKTFSIGFEEEEYNELPYARKVAAIFGTDHHEMVIRPESFDLIEKIIRHFDEPFGDESAIPTYYVSKLAREYVKVVLSGDGGDELFAGYDSYAVTMGRMKYERLPVIARMGLRGLSRILPPQMYGKNFLYNISLPTRDRFIDYVSHLAFNRHAQLLSKDFQGEIKQSSLLFKKYFEDTKSYHELSQLQYVDMRSYLPGDILVKVDRMSMAHSLETRVPLLDHRVVEYVNGLPPRYKMNGKRRKHIFKKIAGNLLPTEIIEKRKTGFGVPLKYWFKGNLKSHIRQILIEPRTCQRGYFNTRYIEALLEEHDRGRRDHSRLLWNLVVFELWHRLYLDEQAFNGRP